MGPSGWVFSYDALFEVLFALITFAIGFFAFKIYSFTGQKRLRTFGMSFLCISASFLILAFVNFGFLSLISGLPVQGEGLLRMVLASHMGLYLLGVIALAYMTLKVQNDMTYWLMVLVTFISIVAATHKLSLFYSISSLFLGYVSFKYLQSYLEKKQFKNLLVLLGFTFFFLGNVTLIFSVQNSMYYILGHVSELAGFLLLLTNFMLILRK